MADSNITKRALAAALKELLEEIPFKKINVADICEKCHMNRKSFYYHFKDKYDLTNWIFDTDMIALMREHPTGDHWDGIERVCEYLYENRSFYCKVFQIQGQNSMQEHFRECLFPLLQNRMEELIGSGEAHRIGVDLFADGIVCAILRWLMDKNCIPPDRFVSIIRKIVENVAITVCEDMK